VIPAQLKAIRITKKVLAGLKISAGQRESEVADQIKLLLKQYRARPAFRIIVASGKRSAVPHGYASDKRIKKGELVVVDFGALYNGYCADITRTFITGKSTEKQRKILRMVVEAQKRAIRAVKAGAMCSDIDLAAREYIKRRCLLYCHISRKKCSGDCFIHSTGHGIGRKVHQAPKISLRNKSRLKAGQVITVEPGIYIKGWGGARIEDMVLVTKRGAKVLT